jgi:Nucleotidyltransferase/DNA polymerase involved in DNA repair
MRRFVRTVLLADMDAFFASVEQAHNPALRGKPVIVCGDPEKRHGIVLAASYEAKRCGVKTAMLVGEARRLCPEAVFVLPRMATYVQISNAILAMMKEITPLVEPFSIDEAFLELPDATDLVRDGVETARRLKDRIRREIGVSCSIGVGPNKLLAKMAAGLEKPDGLTVLTPDDVPTRLWPLPVRELFGVGPRMERHFYRMGIRTIGHLAQATPTGWRAASASWGECCTCRPTASTTALSTRVPSLSAGPSATCLPCRATTAPWTSCAWCSSSWSTTSAIAPAPAAMWVRQSPLPCALPTCPACIARRSWRPPPT